MEQCCGNFILFRGNKLIGPCFLLEKIVMKLTSLTRSFATVKNRCLWHQSMALECTNELYFTLRMTFINKNNVYGMFPRSILGLYDYKINVYR